MIRYEEKNMSEPLLSVSVMTYNHEPYLRQCLQSLVDQETNFPYEIVVGEDCSPDGSRAILKEFEEKYPDKIVPIYHEKNVGMCSNVFDHIFPRLRGKYIAICDGDDYWTDPHKLQKQVDYLEAHPECALTFHHADTINQHGEVKEVVAPSDTIKVYSPMEIIRLSFITVTAVFRNHFREKRPEMLNIYSTDAFIFAVLSGFGGAANLGFNGAHFRHHDGGIFSLKPKFNQYRTTIINRKLMRATSIFSKEQKKALTKEIWRRKTLYCKHFIKTYHPIDAIRILLA